MVKHIAYEKLSKKEKQKIDNCRRKTWGNLNPVTRKQVNSKAYSRKRISTGWMNTTVLILFVKRK